MRKAHKEALITDKTKASNKTLTEKGSTRRKFLKTSAAVGGAALGSGLLTGFPTIWAQNIKNVTLRQFGTGVSNINEIANDINIACLGNVFTFILLEYISPHFEINETCVLCE